MRLLFVTYFFPPFRTSAAVRTGQTAKHLRALGHDVRVVAADRQPWEPGLRLELPREDVVYTPWLGSSLTATVAGRGGTRVDDVGAGDGARGAVLPPPAKRLLRGAQRNLVYLPDDCVGWYPWAVSAALRLLRRRSVDLIYASAGPATSLLAAATVSRVAHVPWVGELRDLWSDNHYRDLPPWFAPVDARLERWVLGSAAGMVTVSEPWAATLNDRYHIPVRTVYNGFEERDETLAPAGSSESGPLVVAHLGMLYSGKRDPTPLFRAIRALGEDAAQVRVEFYGPQPELVRQLARDAGVEERVSARPEVPYAEALRIEAAADVLLLLMWDDPREGGVLPGKLFEYLGARRPVLAVGARDGAAARLISDRRFGLASSDPATIAAQLRAWIVEKRKQGRPQSLPEAAIAEFSRSRQVEQLADFFTHLAAH